MIEVTKDVILSLSFCSENLHVFSLSLGVIFLNMWVTDSLAKNRKEENRAMTRKLFQVECPAYQEVGQAFETIIVLHIAFPDNESWLWIQVDRNDRNKKKRRHSFIQWVSVSWHYSFPIFSPSVFFKSYLKFLSSHLFFSLLRHVIRGKEMHKYFMSLKCICSTFKAQSERSYKKECLNMMRFYS